MDYSKRQDLLGLALDLHMEFTGTYSGMPEEDRAHAERFIAMKLDNWHETQEVFDSAVRTLLLIALEETRASKARSELARKRARET